MKLQKILVLLLCATVGAGAQNVSDYNLRWTEPSDNSAGSMPIGNGETGANVWVENNGDIVFYISRTDSWSETGELFKVGRVRVSVTPSLTADGFAQTLDLGKGKIRICGNGTALDFFIDSESDVIYLTGKAGRPVDVRVKAEVWRDSEFVITSKMAGPRYRSISGFEDGQATFKGYPDIIVSGEDDIAVCHHNCESSYETTLIHEGLNPENRASHDPFIDRTFGYEVTMAGGEKVGDLELAGAGLKKIDIRIATVTGIFECGKCWKEAVSAVADAAPSAKTAMRHTAKWWKKFWNRSYIYVQTPDGETGRKINGTYALQRWVDACGGRGNYPIKFNGSIFTADPEYVDPNKAFGPDYRCWGGDFWWQNTRLPYHPMLKAGDYDLMKPLFEHYFRNLDMMKANAKALCGAEGALSPETQTVFGTFSLQDFEWDRTEATDNLPLNRYIKYHWDSSLEMVALMLDYWDYTGDKEFVKTRLIPYAKEMLTFYLSFYKCGDDGKLVISPTQALETYWYDVVNDTPTVAGLWEAVIRLQKLPAALSGEADKALWKRLEACLPEIPTETVDGKKSFLPALQHEAVRHNEENAELYTVFPFHFCNVSTDNLQMGIDNFKKRISQRSSCWCYDGQQAARLGLTEDAVHELLLKIDMCQGGFRFPVMWGYMDWVPDQCHGGNIMMTLQEMILQTYDGVDYLLPAFPADWGVKYKLHSFGGKAVKGVKKI